jgi:hypothetical protein
MAARRYPHDVPPGAATREGPRPLLGTAGAGLFAGVTIVFSFLLAGWPVGPPDESDTCIVFVDEIDAVGRHRRGDPNSGSAEYDQTLNQLLVEMDGFETDTRVIVIAATNRPDVLDPALLRPGRFDRHVRLDLPDTSGRRVILAVHTRNMPLDSRVDLEVLARQTSGFSGADLANLANEAAIMAARAGRRAVTMTDLEEAFARVAAGPRRSNLTLSQRERAIVAYHEAGHALVMLALPGCDEVRSVSIVARGQRLGWTLAVPAEDHSLVDRTTLADQLAAAMAGRAAEQLVFGDVSTAAEDDIARATQLARRMVTGWGMNLRLGPVATGEAGATAPAPPPDGQHPADHRRLCRHCRRGPLLVCRRSRRDQPHDRARGPAGWRAAPARKHPAGEAGESGASRGDATPSPGSLSQRRGRGWGLPFREAAPKPLSGATACPRCVRASLCCSGRWITSGTGR